jgi:ribose/xylose/arabinose/galactoside ABC-type transport system permease subunit
MSGERQESSLHRRGLLSQNEFGLLVAICAVVVITVLADAQRSYLVDPGGCLQEVLRQVGMLGMFAIGAAMVIIAGGIDLSSGSMIALAGTTCASIMLVLAPQAMRHAQPLGSAVIIAAIAGTLLTGLAVGSLHAFLITRMGMPPFIATLGSLVGLRSAARVLIEHASRLATRTASGSTQIDIFDAQFRDLTRWSLRIPLPSFWSTAWGNLWGGVVKSARWTELVIPAPFLVFIVLAALAALVMSRTVLGRHLYALGGNESAARLSGIRTNLLKWFVYSVSAVLCSIAGIFYIGDQGVAAPEQLARGYELNAIAAAVVGACSLQGGAGTILGTTLGVFFLRTVLDSVAKIIDRGADLYEGMIVGVVVILAVAVSQLRSGALTGLGIVRWIRAFLRAIVRRGRS